MDFDYSPRVEELRRRVREFMDDRVLPEVPGWERDVAAGNPHPPCMEQLKALAKSEGLWNLFLPGLRDDEPGTRLTNLEYAPLAEIMGRVLWASEVFNCSAPDTGNMEILHLFASPQQREQWLRPLLEGEIRSCFAMTEPDVASSDATNIRTSIRREGNEYVINGRKMWITNGTIDENNTPCDLVLVYARTGEKHGRALISTFLVEKDHKGFSVGQKIKDKLGMRGSNTAELVFQDCHVPASALIGHEGDSMLHMMRNLEIERLTLAAMSLGIARRSIEIMNRYAQEREAFGKSLNHFGQMQRYIADSYAEYKAARAYVYETARRMDLNKEGNRLDSDGVKLVATTMAKNVADRAIQVLGGYGYVGEYVVERLWRDAKLLEIGGGTLEAHQKNITRDLAKNPEALYK